MLPEFAAAYVMGLPANLALSGLHAFLFHVKVNSKPMVTVQANLKDLGLYWSDAESKVKRLEKVSDFHEDKSAYFQTVVRLGAICFFLSWLGFVFQLVVMISIRYIAQPKLERAIFTSEIARARLNPERTKSTLNLVASRVMNADLPRF